MNMKKKIIVLLAMLVLAFATTQGIFAQDTTETDNLDNEVNALNQAATEDPTALLTKLSVEFSVDLVVLQDLYTQGYTPGQIWLALEITKTSTTTITLQDAILVAGTTEGHGWGVLAQTLGIAPGSADFHALKLNWGQHQGQLIKEMNQEREQNGNGNANDGNGKGGTESGNGNKGFGKK